MTFASRRRASLSALVLLTATLISCTVAEEPAEPEDPGDTATCTTGGTDCDAATAGGELGEHRGRPDHHRPSPRPSATAGGEEAQPTPAAPTAAEPSALPEPIPVGDIASSLTTGVPAGVSLERKSGDMNITRDGTVVDGIDLTGDIWIDADDVTIRNSRIVGNGFSVIQIKNGSKNVSISRSEIDGKGQQAGSMGIMGPADVTGVEITGVENGLTPGSGSVLTRNWVHGLKAPGDPHYDGVQIDGGLSNITIRYNRVDLSEHDQTAAVMIDNYFGPVSKVVVEHNLLRGGGYTVYSDGQFDGGPITGVVFRDNLLGKGYYGYALVRRSEPVWTNNVDLTSSKLIGY